MGDTLLTKRDGALVTLTLNRPDKLNAIDAELLGELDAALRELSQDASVACAILTGAGEKAFAAGADIGAMLELSTEQARSFSALGHRVGMMMERAPFPIIGAVNGFALGGGCELALACDFLYASDKAKLGQPEVNLGLIPICYHCRRIRDDKGYWSQLEEYIRERSDAEFSHGLCPECAEKYYGEYIK